MTEPVWVMGFALVSVPRAEDSRSMGFHDLVTDDNIAKVRAAIDDGTELDAIDIQGFTPLMIACAKGHDAIARLLIERGAKLTVVGRLGETALKLAIVHCANIAELLVERGVLGRPLRTPAQGTLLSPSDCDVCTRYPDTIDPGDKWSGTPARLAWLEVVSERRSTEGKAEAVERQLRCPLCGTRYEHSFYCEIETAGVTPPYVAESIRRLPTDFPTALLGALFVAEDGKLACQIERGEKDMPFRTTVWAGIGGSLLLDRAHTTWRPAKNTRSQDANERLGQLQAELGTVGLGNLYELYVVRGNPDLATFGDKEWIAALPETPLTDLRLFPQHGQSPYTSDMWDWQDGWWYPYSTFRPATTAERDAHFANMPRGIRVW